MDRQECLSYLLLCDALGFFDRFFDRADHVKSLFRQIIMLTVNDLAEASNRILEFDVLPFQSGELRRNEKWLREETLYAARARNDQLVFVGQFIKSQNRNDVLQIFVTLQHAFHVLRRCVVLSAMTP